MLNPLVNDVAQLSEYLPDFSFFVSGQSLGAQSRNLVFKLHRKRTEWWCLTGGSWR
jgi:hypothetical protein